jgi:tRNA (guanine37-N1)-methyltransferase
MRFDIVTIFPEMITQALAAGVVGRAIERGTIEVAVHDLRAFTTDRHHVVDDVPFGGGPGMLLKPDPIFRALDQVGREARVLLTSPQGTRLTQPVVQRLSAGPRLVIVCGRYEGVDERVRSRIDEEISIGDYVLSGGELAALVVVDAVARLVPGVVGDQQSVADDSFSRGLLDYPQYTRPAELTWDRGAAGTIALRVPDVLLSGNHAAIRRWRKEQAVARTLARRPEWLEAAALDEEEQAILRALLDERKRSSDANER